MLAEPSHNSRATREKIVELMFERFQVPALYLAKAAVLSSFAMARQTSLVVDVGHRATSGVCQQMSASHNTTIDRQNADTVIAQAQL